MGIDDSCLCHELIFREELFGECEGAISQLE
jgi:hypothetical protein